MDYRIHVSVPPQAMHLTPQRSKYIISDYFLQPREILFRIAKKESSYRRSDPKLFEGIERGVIEYLSQKSPNECKNQNCYAPGSHGWEPYIMRTLTYTLPK